MRSHTYSAGVLLASVVTSFAIPLAKGDSQYVLTVQTHKGSAIQQTTLMDKDKNHIYFSSCSNTLNTDALKNDPITAKLDQDGSGTITIGSQVYKVHEDHAVSGGISCGRIFSDDEHFVSCDIALPDSLGVAKANAKNAACFGDQSSPMAPRFHKHGANINQNLNKPHPAHLNSQTSKSRRAVPFGKRQYECDAWESVTEVYERTKGDNGDPHQNYLDKQLSEIINCDASPTCSVGETNSKSYNIGWSASATAWEWLTAGFDVGMSWTTGNSYTCGGNTGDTVCVWYSTAHTAYTVENHSVNTVCGGDNPSGGPFVMFSPNSQNRGGKGYYCVVGANFCRAQGDQYWDYSGPAGGPQ